jgi:hypothetical protein
MTVMIMEAGAPPAAMAPRFAEPLAMRELANLDFLRALAVGYVFIGKLLATMRIRATGDFGHFGALLSHISEMNSFQRTFGCAPSSVFMRV